MKFEFNTNEFVKSHGKQPKGTGSWAFQITHLNGFSGPAPIEFSPCLTLTEAKRWIKAKAQA